jgi:hypothetical protein
MFFFIVPQRTREFHRFDKFLREICKFTIMLLKFSPERGMIEKTIIYMPNGGYFICSSQFFPVTFPFIPAASTHPLTITAAA